MPRTAGSVTARGGLSGLTQKIRQPNCTRMTVAKENSLPKAEPPGPSHRPRPCPPLRLLAGERLERSDERDVARRRSGPAATRNPTRRVAVIERASTSSSGNKVKERRRQGAATRRGGDCMSGRDFVAGSSIAGKAKCCCTYKPSACASSSLSLCVRSCVAAGAPDLRSTVSYIYYYISAPTSCLPDG